MMKKLLLALGACALPVSMFAATYVVPVATARLKDRLYSTTLAFHNEGSLPARCEAIYAVPNDPKGGTLRTTYEISAGGAPLVEEDVLRDVGAIGTMRIACTSGVVNMNLYITGNAAEQAAIRAAALRAFQQAGFTNVYIEGENVGTILHATR
jgi:hypothetical protein